MNIAIPRGKSGHKPPFVAAIVAGTILGVVSGVGLWQAVDPGSGSGPLTVSTANRRIDFISQDTRTMVLYLVDSQEQADMVWAGEAEAAMERAGAGVAEPNYFVEVMTITTLQDEENLRDILESWSTAPGGVRLVDYRGQ